MRAESPLVSVCVPTFNHRSFIEAALRSAAEQDYERLEIIVGDDGSTDGTADAIAAVAGEYPERIRVLPSTPNRGLPGVVLNYNRLLGACNGKYVAFLEGDDIYLPGKISAQVQWLEEDPTRVLCGHDVEVFDSASDQRMYLWSERFGMRQGRGAESVIRTRVPFSTVAVMVRADAIPTAGFDERLRVVLDWKFWIDCLSRGGSYGYVTGVRARYRKHITNISTAFASIGREDQFMTLALIECRRPDLAQSCRYGRASLFYTTGIDALFAGHASAARVAFTNCLRTHAGAHWKAIPGWLLSMLPARLRASLLVRSGPTPR